MSETWIINKVPNIAESVAYIVNFYDYAGRACTRLVFVYNDSYNGNCLGGMQKGGGINVFYASRNYGDGWNYAYPEHATLIFDEPVTGDLLIWLQSNAKKPSSGKTCTITYNGQTIAETEESDTVNITYNGSTIATLNEGDTKTLQCNGKVMQSDVVIGNKTLSCNGKLMASDVVVEVEG